MFNRSKVQKKGDAKVTELEEETAKSLVHLEQSRPEVAQHSKFLYINSVATVEHELADGTQAKYILVRIPFRSLAFYKKIQDKVIDHLENTFKVPVIVTANRTIISKRAKHHASQMRPRSRTLKAVHAATLEDIITPSTITGRQTRVSLESKRFERIFLDPLDKELMEPKLEALTHCYKTLTTHDVHFEFSRPTSFQKKKLDNLKKAKAAQ